MIRSSFARRINPKKKSFWILSGGGTIVFTSCYFKCMIGHHYIFDLILDIWFIYSNLLAVKQFRVCPIEIISRLKCRYKDYPKMLLKVYKRKLPYAIIVYVGYVVFLCIGLFILK